MTCLRVSTRALVQTALLGALALFWSGCGEEFHEPWRDQALASGKTVKVKSLQIAWGVEHDEPRSPQKDCFVLQFVYAAPDAGDDAHAREAKEVFELIRPVSEQWGFTSAELMAYSTTEPDRHYDLFFFQRDADGKWASKLDRH
ncbi:MAG TPA: hypothetical protein VHD32_00075 [Candidatus Didemnitutus sp.]|nr:hypothetical protein [Candidatus Didemnitutus sp.]